jgi:hypothetical protein
VDLGPPSLDDALLDAGTEDGRTPGNSPRCRTGNGSRLVQGVTNMTVIERLYDNDWYVLNASPAARESLAADVTRAWMAKESAHETANRARTVAGLAPARSAVALSLGNAAQAEYDRARARAAEAARCTDIVAGHAFTVSRVPSEGGGMTIEVASCTLLRRATLSASAKGQPWRALLTDPQSRWRDSISRTLSTDPWEAFHAVCDWITGGQL